MAVHSGQEAEGDDCSTSEGGGSQDGTESGPAVPGTGEAMCPPLHCLPHLRLLPQPPVLHRPQGQREIEGEDPLVTLSLHQIDVSQRVEVKGRSQWAELEQEEEEEEAFEETDSEDMSSDHDSDYEDS